MLVYSIKKFNKNLSCQIVKKEQNRHKKYPDNLRHSYKWLTSDSHDSTLFKRLEFFS